MTIQPRSPVFRPTYRLVVYCVLVGLVGALAAMAFGLLSLRQPALVVEDPDCVSKSYPRFWQDLERFK